EYPAIFAATSLNDTRVFFVEPAKWVARLRETVTSDQEERPILFRCEMVAGHGGRSGRYRKWEQRAEELAWLLDQLGATELIGRPRRPRPCAGASLRRGCPSAAPVRRFDSGAPQPPRCTASTRAPLRCAGGPHPRRAPPIWLSTSSHW